MKINDFCYSILNKSRKDDKSMKKMNDPNAGVLIGVGLAVAVGILSFIFTSDNAKEKTKAVVNRKAAKKVFNKLGGDKKKSSKVLDKLSDDEINSLVSTADKVKDLESSLSDVTADLKHFFSDKMDDAKKVVK